MHTNLASSIDGNGATVSPELFASLARLESKIDDLRATLAQKRKALYTVAEFAALTGRAPYTVRRWITEGRLKATRVQGTGPRGRLLIANTEIDRLMADGLAGSVPAMARREPR